MRGHQFYEKLYDEQGNDTRKRQLHIKKVTAGKPGLVIEIELNEDGVPMRLKQSTIETEEGPKTLGGAILAKMEHEKQTFMDAIERNFAIGVFFSASPPKRNYAPKSLVTAEKGKNRQARIDSYARIMSDLINENRIISEQYGSPRDDKWHLKVLSRTGPAVACV
jgi:hypothetical protein